ncbi:hypothetical protein [Brevundimonas sp.]|uniref:hypothetical protein n=1 Tax=Brevundimonas sp. TaxID=1871086 RepID=UPI0017E87DDD|nr:hypothetical protein [Brevundimonas sp.]MBA4806893.1 hypothetical protein [Brevundimonas sp.]
MSVKDEVDRAIHAYHGDDLQGATVGFELWDAFCRETGLTPQPAAAGGDDLEVIYQGLSIKPGIAPDTIRLVTGF